ncbi:hypothetical protein PMAYCL1PPCAC_25528, partial [Pristionchus mayeri]
QIGIRRDRKNVIPKVYDAAYGHDECGRFLQVVPIKDSCTLKINFPMPDLTHEYMSNSCGYIFVLLSSHILLHEGRGR